MNRFFAIGFFVLVLIIFSGKTLLPKEESINTIFESPLQSLTLGSVTIKVAIADTQNARQQGLSYIKQIPQKYGLLFVFPEKDLHGIWMKDMKFSIDVIWLDEQFKIVDIDRNVSPDTYPQSFHPQVPARYTLEVNEDFSSEFDVEIGSTVTLKSL